MFTPTASLLVTAGTTYLIRVDTYPNLWGHVLSSFTLAVTPGAAPPANDECTGALPLVAGLNGPYSNPTATTSAGGYPGYVDVWYSFTTGACPGPYTVEQCPNPTMFLDFRAGCGGPTIGNGNENALVVCGGTRRTSRSRLHDVLDPRDEPPQLAGALHAADDDADDRRTALAWASARRSVRRRSRRTSAACR